MSWEGQETIDIRDYGAVADSDGSGGGSDTFLAAMAAAEADARIGNPAGNVFERSKGRKIYIPAGKWRVPRLWRPRLCGGYIGEASPGQSGRSGGTILVVDPFVCGPEFTGDAVTFTSWLAQFRDIAVVSANLPSLTAGGHHEPFQRGETGLSVDDIRTPIHAKKHGYALRVVDAGTGTVGSTCPVAPDDYPLIHRVKSVTGNGVGPIELEFWEPHNLVGGETRVVYGVGGNTAANGTWDITITSTTKVTLDGSTGNGDWDGADNIATMEPEDFTNGGVLFRWIEVWGLKYSTIGYCENVDVGGFPGNGLYVSARVPGSDASAGTFRRMRCEGNYNGISVWGQDANAGYFENIHAESSSGHGWIVDSFADNVFVACANHNSYGVGVKATGGTWVTFYNEGSGVPKMGQAATCVGGTWGQQVDEDVAGTLKMTGHYNSKYPITWSSEGTSKVGAIVKLPNFPDWDFQITLKDNGAGSYNNLRGTAVTFGTVEPTPDAGENWRTVGEHPEQGYLSGDAVLACIGESAPSNPRFVANADNPAKITVDTAVDSGMEITIGGVPGVVAPTKATGIGIRPTAKGNGGAGFSNRSIFEFLVQDTTNNLFQFRAAGADANTGLSLTPTNHAVYNPMLFGFHLGLLLGNGSYPGTVRRRMLAASPAAPTGAPASGKDWLRGDELFPSAPVAGDPFAIRCLVDGDTGSADFGTWERLYPANLGSFELGDETAHTIVPTSPIIKFTAALTAAATLTLPALTAWPDDLPITVLDFSFDGSPTNVSLAPNGTDKINGSNTTQVFFQTAATPKVWRVYKINNTLGWMFET
jgi:hypothetical protein